MLQKLFATVTGQIGNIRITKTGIDLEDVHKVNVRVMGDIPYSNGANARIYVYDSSGVELANCNPVILMENMFTKIDLDLDYQTVSIDNTKAKIANATIVVEIDKGSISGSAEIYVSHASAISYTEPIYEWDENSSGLERFTLDDDGDLVPT